jgi:hypothetical protein
VVVSFQILANLSFTDHPLTWYESEVLKALVNKHEISKVKKLKNCKFLLFCPIKEAVGRKCKNVKRPSPCDEVIICLLGFCKAP